MTHTDWEPFELTPIDQQEGQVYVRTQLAFHLNDVRECETLLQQGLERLTQELPFLCREIVIQVDGDGVERIVSRLLPWQDLLTVKHHTRAMRKVLIEVGHDRARLDRQFMPVPVCYPDLSHPCPVLAVQVNIHPDGVLLAVATNHQVIDAKGQSIVIRCLADCCRLAQGEVLDLHSGPAEQARGREMLIHQLPARILDREFPDYRVCENLAAGATPLATVGCAHFTLPAEEVAALKGRCNDMIAQILGEEGSAARSQNRTWVSSSDVVSALMWLTICRAKHPELSMPSATSFDEVVCLGLAVDTRRRLSPSLPATYIGNAAIGILVRTGAERITSTDVVPTLCRVALAIRKKIDATDSDEIRGLLSYIQNEPNHVMISDAATCFISNWRQMEFYLADFGLPMGKPEYIRTPDAVGDGMVFIMPKRSPLDESPWEIQISLKHESLLRLKEDAVWTAYLRPDVYWP